MIGPAGFMAAPKVDGCGQCHDCIEARDRDKPWNERWMGMILCPICGNKRCPHATDHAFNCTNSNEPGQPGSNYPKRE